MQNYDYYSLLVKPSFAPPAWIFGPVWTVLYIIITITFIRIFYLASKRIIPVSVAVPFILNLIVNLSFTYLQFGLKNNYLAAVDVALVLITLVWGIVKIFPYSRKLAYWQAPYLLWVSFATVLQLAVTYLNR